MGKKSKQCKFDVFISKSGFCGLQEDCSFNVPTTRTKHREATLSFFFCRLPLGFFLQHFFIFYFYCISSLSLSFSKNYLELPRVRAVLSKPTSLYLKLSECACILNDSKELSLRSVVVNIQIIFASSLWEHFGCGLQADCWLVNAEGEEMEAFSLIGSE